MMLVYGSCMCAIYMLLERILCYKCTAGAAAALPYMREYDEMV